MVQIAPGARQQPDQRLPQDQAGQAQQPDQSAEKDHDEEHAQELRSPSGRIVHQAILVEGEEELKRSASALLWSGLAAGLSMGFSLIAEGMLQAHLPDRPWRPMISKLGYSLGFLIVILGRQQLFTENTLTPILPLMKEKSAKVLANVLRLWTLVLVANLVGAMAVAWATQTRAFDEGTRAAFVDIGQKALSHGFGLTLWRGVFAGWLIALMVWLLPFAETARVWVIIILTYIVGLGSFSHIIAGAVEVFGVAWGGQAGWGKALWWLVPTLIGNILGGVTLVAAINHAQVVAGAEGEDV